MFASVAGFEVRYQLRQPVFWVVTTVFFLMTFLSVASPDVHIGGDNPNIHKNAPFAIAQTTLILTLFFMFATTAFVANVVVRDEETGFGPILRTTRVSRFDYVLGRFAGAFATVALAFLAVPLAIWLGSLAPWLDPETLGPNRLAYYASAYLILALPGLFVTAAAFFLVACLARSMIAAYLAVIAMLVVWTVGGAVVREAPQYRHLAALVDPFGLFAYRNATRYWTAYDANSLTVSLSGELLWSRGIWVAIGFACLGLAYGLFRPTRPGEAAKAAPNAVRATPAAARTGALPRPVFTARTARVQLLARTRLDIAQVFKSPAFAVLLALGVFNAVGSLLFAGAAYGVDITLVTRIAIGALRDSFSFIPAIIALFYAGELVWRDRDRRLHEIIDATAAPDWAFVLPKILAISAVLIATYLVSVAAAMAVQLIKHVPDLEPWRYLVWYVAPESVTAILIATLAVFTQAVAPHKFVGSAIMLMIYIVGPLVLPGLGWEDRLYLYGAAPPAPLSDMNGVGRLWAPGVWFQTYWSAFALALVVLAHALWRRGAQTRLRPRLARLPARLRSPAGVILALALTAFAGLGGFIYLNTHIWNAYSARGDTERRQADYEKAFLRFETVAQPTVTDVAMTVDLHPHAGSLQARGTYALRNASVQPISQVHVRFDTDTRVRRLEIEGARRIGDFPRFNYFIFRFDRPLAPGQTARLTFESERGRRGFGNDGYPTDIVDNGTFLRNFAFAPVVGMDREGLLTDRSKRKRYGLAPDLRMAPLDTHMSARGRNVLANASWVRADITVSTDADQTPIAPGDKVSDQVLGGRRIARFLSEAPVLNAFSIQSARYAERHEIYKGVDLGVFYHPAHGQNVDRMIASAKTGLDTYQAAFGPYPFHQYREVEFPAYQRYAESFANTVPWSEDLGFLADLRDPNKIDYVSYVGAHELAHQWWGHQLIGADMQGAEMLSETLAQYSALIAMERLYGPDKIRRFLKFELDQYLKGRGGAGPEELPLLRVENQPYVYYHKGALAMYLLKDQIGESPVNAALQGLLDRYAFQGPPYPTTRDLISALRAQVLDRDLGLDKQSLITDLFERITLYDVSASAVRATRRPDGRWNVRLTVEASKLYADGAGHEHETTLNAEPFDVGLFSAKPGEGPFGAGDVILFVRTPLHSGRQVLDFVVAKKPAWAGVDPYNKRIDRNAEDNLIQVE
jgi:aminopeptidase N